MIVLRSIAFLLAFYTGSLVAVLAALPASLRGDPAVRGHAERWALFHRWCCRHLLAIEHRVEGVLPEGPVLIACKHQSMYETVEMVLIGRGPAIVLKHELASMPFWGKVAKAYGAIPIVREGSAGALRAMIRSGRQMIADGRPILIFPEGTRVAPGEQPELKSGFAGLYRQLGLPVVPVALDSGRLWPRKSFLKRSGVITFRFGEIIPAGLSRAEIEARVHAAINVLEQPAA